MLVLLTRRPMTELVNDFQVKPRKMVLQHHTKLAMVARSLAGDRGFGVIEVYIPCFGVLFKLLISRQGSR